MAVFVFFCFGEHLLVTRCTQNYSLGSNFHFLVLFLSVSHHKIGHYLQ